MVESNIFCKALSNFENTLDRILHNLNESNCDELVCNGFQFVGLYKGQIFYKALPQVFSSNEELILWLQILARSCGQYLDPNVPSQGGDIKGFRWHAVLPSMSRGGPLFCLRKSRFESFCLEAFVSEESECDKVILGIQECDGFLISGATNCGKSSLMFSLLQRLTSDRRVVIVESVPELPLSNPQWLGLKALKGVQGDWSCADVMRESLRLRPDFIAVGEIRGNESRVYFDCLSLGLPCGATIHAQNSNMAIQRLIELSYPGQRFANDFSVFVVHMNRNRKIADYQKFDLSRLSPR